MANAIGPEVLLVAEGGEVIERVTTSQPCYACMLGGDDGKTLFAITAESSDGKAAAAAKTGKVEIMSVNKTGAGWP